MKLIIKYTVSVILVLFLSINLFSQYITLEGKQFKDGNGENFYPLACNYVMMYVNKMDENSSFSNSFISPWPRYGETNLFECDSQPICNQQLLNDFNEMIALGFNCVRIYPFGPYYVPNQTKLPYWKICNWKCDTSGFYIPVSNIVQDSCKDFTRILLPYPFNTTDPVVAKLFDHYRNVLEVVSQAEYEGKKLKAIIVTGGANGNYDPEFTGTYNVYLAKLVDYLKTNLTTEAKYSLLAYDLFNEPGYCWWGDWPYYSGIPTKEDVCNAFSLWYQTIKNIDPIHLVTVGGWAEGDIFDFDPNILTLDFYSIHFYPGRASYEPQFPENDYTNMISRIKGRLYWFQNNLSLPWIIGETGFGARTGATKSIDGTEDEQKQYADETTDFVRNCDGSGYSWWTYQDEGNPDGDGPFWGVLKNGKVDSNHLLKKPVSQVFENFTTPIPNCECEKPSNYYDPYNHEDYNPFPGQNWVIGHVRDLDGNPIKDAYVIGRTHLYDEFDPDGKVIHIGYDHYTYTQPDGGFEIIPYEYDTLIPYYNTVERLLISAPGCSNKIIQGTSENGIPDSLVEDIRLEKVSIGYDEEITGIINGGSNVIYESSDKLTFKDLGIFPGANCEGKARNEINLLTELTAMSASEVWMHLEPVFFPCQELNFSTLKQSWIDEKSFKNIDEPYKEIELNFTLLNEEFGLIIFPNPGEGLFSIQVVDSVCLLDLSISVFDEFGRELLSLMPESHSFKINLSNYKKGVYLIKARNSDRNTVKKIILI